MNIMQSPKVSVIVPIHNAEKTIIRCIESLVNQSLKDLEIILVNDNSTDKTDDIIREYQQLYPTRITVLQSHKPKEICGPGYARNVGIKAARGIYLGFVDSDDWVDSNLFSIVYNKSIEANADVAVFGVKNEYSNTICSQIRYQYEYNTINHVYALHMLCRLHNNDCFISPMACSKIYRADYIRKNNLYFDTDSFFEDDQFTFCCFLHDCKTLLIPQVYYHYYQNAESITHTFSKKYIDTLVTTFVNIRSYLQTYSCYEMYYDDYHAYMDKCVSSTLNTLFCAEKDIVVQKKYIIYLLKKINENFSIDEWVHYFDIQRIQRFLGINK